MNQTKFWQLMDRTRLASYGDGYKQANLIGEELRKMKPNDIIAYNRIMQSLMDTAYKRDLWDAAYIIGCGCSDDGFMDFRAWLVGQGKQAYEDAIDNPNSLLNRVNVDQHTQIQDMWAMPMVVYEDITGQELPLAKSQKPELGGRTLSEEQVMSKLPELAKKFGDCSQWDDL